MAGKGFNIRAWLGLDTKDYEKGISKAKRQASQFGKGLSDSIKSATGNVTGMLDRMTGGAISGFTGMFGGIMKATRGMNLFKVALASTGIGALVIALGALVTYFTKTEDGQKKITVAMNAFKGVVGVVGNYLEAFGRVLVDIWNNPKDALKSLGDAIKNQFFNRIQAVGDYITALKDIATSAFGFIAAKTKELFSSGDAKEAAKKQAEDALSGMKDGLKGAADASLQMLTGFDSAQRSKIIEGAKKVGKDFAKGFSDGVQQGIDINALGDAERAARVAVKNLANEVSALRLKSRDRAKYDEAERLAFIEEAQRKTKELYAIEYRLADERIRLKAKEMAMSPTNIADLEEMADLEAARVGILEQQNMRMMELTEQASTLKDALLKGTETNDAVEQLLPAGSIAEAEAKLGKLKDAWKNATDEGTRGDFLKQIEDQETAIDKLTGRYQESGKGIAGANAEIAASFEEIRDATGSFSDSLEKIGLTGASALGQLVTAFMDLSDAVQAYQAVNSAMSAAKVASDSAETASAVAKTGADSGAAIAGATKSGAGLPFPLNLVAIAAGVASVIAALANVAKFESGGMVGGNSFTGDNIFARVNSGEMILNKKQQSNLFSMINRGGGGGGEVVFRLKGTDLIGSINNRTSRTKSYR